MTCKNCSIELHGKFCHECGEKVIEENDFSLVKIIGEFFQALTFLDNKVFRTVWNLISKPGLLSSEYLEGRRIKYLRPIGLFFLVNIVYFLAGSLNDFTPDLSHQYYYTPYKNVAQKIINEKVEEQKTNYEDFQSRFNVKSENYAKSLVIVNVPLLAFFFFSLNFKRRAFYAQHLIFSFHYFAFILLAITIIPAPISWIVDLLDSSSNYESVSQLVILILVFAYSFFSLQRFYQHRWYMALILSILIFPILFICMTAFKFVLLHFTLYWM